MAALGLVDAPNQHGGRTAIAEAAGISGLVFLIVHGACHLLHVAGVELPAVAARVPTPLFANVISGVPIATATFLVVATSSAGGRPRWGRLLRLGFLLVPALFAVAIIVFP